jgi:hypothetical protein
MYQSRKRYNLQLLWTAAFSLRQAVAIVSTQTEPSNFGLGADFSTGRVRHDGCGRVQGIARLAENRARIYTEQFPGK